MDLKSRLNRKFPQAYLPELGALLGTDLLEKFLATFAGICIRVPRVKALEAVEKDLAIYARLTSSRTVEEFVEREQYVVERYGVTRGQVRKILRGYS